jgi:hypothetical protein
MLKLAFGPDWKMIGPREFLRADPRVRLYVDPTRFVAPTAREEVVGRSSLVTPEGWSVDCTEIRLTLPGDKVEHELRARYHMRDARPLVVIAGSPDHIAQLRAELDAIVCSATLDVAAPATPTCLADLFADVDE